MTTVHTQICMYLHSTDNYVDEAAIFKMNGNAILYGKRYCVSIVLYLGKLVKLFKPTLYISVCVILNTQ